MVDESLCERSLPDTKRTNQRHCESVTTFTRVPKACCTQRFLWYRGRKIGRERRRGRKGGRGRGRERGKRKRKRKGERREDGRERKRKRKKEERVRERTEEYEEEGKVEGKRGERKEDEADSVLVRSTGAKNYSNCKHIHRSSNSV